jgi:RimJ/RimL family protein N-acetyltransferase
MCQKDGRVVFRRGPRLYLRPFDKSDIPLFVRWVNDQEVTRGLTITRPLSTTEEEQWFEQNVKDDSSVKLLMVLNEGDRPIGSIGLHQISHLHGTAVMGWSIGETTDWGKGYGPEALRLLLDYAFLDLNLRKITAGVFDFNDKSQKALEKCGFQLEARLCRHRYRQGRYVDELLFAQSTGLGPVLFLF